MKKFSLFLFLALGLLAMSAHLSAQTSYALCVGLSKCGTPGAEDVSTPQHDAADIKKVLAKQGYKVGAVTNKHATRSNILDRVGRIVKAAKSPDDKILLYIATHGDDGVLLTYGGEVIKYSELIDILSQSKTRHIYCFVMACHSGSALSSMSTDADWATNANKWGITFVVSCRPNEYSFSSGVPHWRHSYFGQAIIKGLRGQADRNDDRQVTLMELFRYTYNEVTGRSGQGEDAQHPQLIGPKGEHDTVLARW